MSESGYHESQPLPECEVIFQDTSVDGSLMITIWRDPSPQTGLMRERDIEAMGILRIYDMSNIELVHMERVPLSESIVSGPGPTEDETEYWSSLLDRYMD